MLPKNFPHKKEAKRKEAAERKAELDKLSATERLARLDKTFGVGVGATRERARLVKLLPKEAPQESQSTENLPKKNKKK